MKLPPSSDLVLLPPDAGDQNIILPGQVISGVTYNPLIGIKPIDMRWGQAGSTLAELAPDAMGGLLVCRLNGGPGYVSRADWSQYRVAAGDIVEWCVYPQNRGALAAILTIALVFIAPYLAPYLAGTGATATGIAVAQAAIIVAGSIAIQALLGPSATSGLNGQQAAASATYNTSLSGNQPKLYDVIPKICGRHFVNPSFAGQPYMRYDSFNDQYYYALFAVGIGNHNLEREMIDNTTIQHFADVKTHNYLPPGTTPTKVVANIVNAQEVAAQELKSGIYVGGFAACPPMQAVNAIEIDVLADRGLGYASDSGAYTDLTVFWQVEGRLIDDFGRATGVWNVVATEYRTAHTATPQRWTNIYTLTTPGRYEIRVVRTNAFADDSRSLNTIVWAALRGHLTAAAPLNPNVAHYEVVLRASDQLSQLSQRQIGLIVRALVRTWTPLAGWGPEVESRNGAWWLVELATNTTWGLGFPEDRIDLQSFYELSVLWDERQDHFDYVFDTVTDAWEAMQTIARAGRARVFRRNGIISIARDSLADIPVTAFTPRNCLPNTMSVQEQLPTINNADGMIVEYFDYIQWNWVPLEFPLPGVPYITTPVRQRIEGVTGPTHATREGLYMVASMLYRQRIVNFVTEMQGMLPAYMSPVMWQPEVGYGQTGDVVHWQLATLTMGLSERPILDGDNNYLWLVRDDGSVTSPIHVVPGVGFNEVILATGIDFDPILDDPTRERPKFVLGKLDTVAEIAKISAISDGGKDESGAQLYKIEAVIDDDRVHTADNAYLPGPGEIQDPIPSGVDVDSADGIPRLNFAIMASHDVGPATFTNGVQSCSLSFNTDGTQVATTVLYTPWPSTTTFTTTFNDGWLNFRPGEPTDAQLFEVQVVDYHMMLNNSAAAFTGPSLNTWHQLGLAPLVWTLDDSANTYFNQYEFFDLQFNVRLIGTTIPQATAVYTFNLFFDQNVFTGGGSSGGEGSGGG